MMLSRDGAAIYACCSFSAGTTIDHNWIHDTQSLITGAADDYFYSGIYVDNGTSGFLIEQNVLWNNQFDAIFLNANGVTTPNDNIVENNSFPDVNSLNSYPIVISQIPNCGTMAVINNLILVPVDNGADNPACLVSDNSLTAPGATDMNSSVQVGCNFEATFSVTGAGTAPLSYLWLVNGVKVASATNSTYMTPAATAAADGTSLSVQVSNALGNVTSNPVTLHVD
jgi:hypothetical protein